MDFQEFNKGEVGMNWEMRCSGSSVHGFEMNFW